MTAPAAPAASFPLPGLAPGGSLQLVLQRRLEQVEKYGHTPAADRALPPDFLIPAALERLQAARERLKGDFIADHHHAAIRALTTAAACILANIDRLQMELAEAEGSE